MYDFSQFLKSSNLTLYFCFNYLINYWILLCQKIISGLGLALSQELMAIHFFTTSKAVAINRLSGLLAEY